MLKRPRHRTQTGFTIIELMVTVVILAVVTAFALPSMRDFIRRSNSTALSNQLLTALSLARSEALRSGRRTTVCASDNGTACTNNGFAMGYIVFIDSGIARSVDVSDVVVQVFDKPAGNPLFQTSITSVSYLPSGMREPTSAGAPLGNCFEFIVGDSESARAHVHVNTTGAVRTGKGVCAV